MVIEIHEFSTDIDNIYKGVFYRYIQDNKDSWIPRIQKFQRENSLHETGYINPNDPTYNILKCKMAQDLNLTEKFSDCNQI